jgi:hypothetical protein
MLFLSDSCPKKPMLHHYGDEAKKNHNNNYGNVLIDIEVLCIEE